MTTRTARLPQRWRRQTARRDASHAATHDDASAVAGDPGADDGEMLTPDDLEHAAEVMTAAAQRLRLAASGWRAVTPTSLAALTRQADARLSDAALAIKDVLAVFTRIEQRGRVAVAIAAQIEAAQQSARLDAQDATGALTEGRV